MTEAEKERAEIVAYLRECEEIHLKYLAEGNHKTASKHHADACHYAADAIESLTHKAKDTDHG